MEKRTIWILVASGVLILSLIAGILAYQWVMNQKTENKMTEMAKEEKVSDECTEEYERLETASSTEEKITPNTEFILRKKYKQCNHIISTKVELPKEMVNKTQEEIEKMYQDFTLESFSKEEVIFLKEEEGICKEHFLLKEENGKVVIKRVDAEGNEEMVEETGIASEYLPQTDVIQLRKGIKIVGKDKLNSILEDFE